MAQKQPSSKQMEKLPFNNLMSPELAEIGKQRMEYFINAQVALLDDIRETNQQWLDRIEAETHLGTQFASKLASAQSVPDTISACQDWTTQRFGMMAEDIKHILADTQKFMERGARLVASGTRESTSNPASG